MNEPNISEIQKAAEWVRHARTNHAVYRDTSSQAELVAALEDLAKAQASPIPKP